MNKLWDDGMRIRGLVEKLRRRYAGEIVTLCICACLQEVTDSLRCDGRKSDEKNHSVGELRLS